MLSKIWSLLFFYFQMGFISDYLFIMFHMLYILYMLYLLNSIKCLYRDTHQAWVDLGIDNCMYECRVYKVYTASSPSTIWQVLGLMVNNTRAFLLRWAFITQMRTFSAWSLIFLVGNDLWSWQGYTIWRFEQPCNVSPALWCASGAKLLPMLKIPYTSNFPLSYYQIYRQYIMWYCIMRELQSRHQRHFRTPDV